MPQKFLSGLGQITHLAAWPVRVSDFFETVNKVCLCGYVFVWFRRVASGIVVANVLACTLTKWNVQGGMR